MPNTVKLLVEDFEKEHGIRLLPKSKCWPMRLVGIFSKSFMDRFWTTYRLPFCKGIISYPEGTTVDVQRYSDLLQHELIHVEQQSSAWGLFKSALFVSVFPLPIWFSGRWFIERPAYLQDIKAKRYTVGEAVDVLWNGYGWPWPRSMMKRWFLKELGRGT